MSAAATSEPQQSTSSAPPILFYEHDKPYAEFSNFAAFPIVIDGLTWPTTEHYFQGAKFNDAELQKKVREAATPGKAFQLGRNPGYASKLRQDWDTYRMEAMMTAIRAKFTQHEVLKKLLLETGDAEIVENSPKDAFWGIGKEGNGKNHLGRLLMQLREEIRTGSTASPSS